MKEIACAFSIVFLSMNQLLFAVDSFENRWLKLECSSADAVTLTDKSSGKVVARCFSLLEGSEFKAAVANNPVWGRGTRIEAIARQRTTTFTLYESSPFLFVHSTVHNATDKPLVVASLESFKVRAELGAPVDQLRSYGTGFLKSLDAPATSFSFTALVEPDSRRGLIAAQLTHQQSSGVFTTQVEGDAVSIRGRLDFGRFQVDAGKSRKTDTFVIGYFEDARVGLETYADAIARHHSIKLKTQAVDYCTWYHARASDEKKLAENTRFAARHLAPFGLDVIQIDDDWQKLTPSFSKPETRQRGKGPVKTFVESKENYSGGMAATASNITNHKFTAGLWFMRFAGGYRTSYFADKQDLFVHWPDGTPVEDPRWSGTLLDLTNPKTQAFVHERTKRIYDWGYRYFKLDGLHTGTVTYNVYVNTDWRTQGLTNSRNFVGDQKSLAKIDSNEPSTALHDPTKTHIEAYRIGLDTLRKAAPDAFLLGCNVSQNMRSMGAAFDKIDAMRIGPDNGRGGSGRWDHVTKGAVHGSNLYFLNARVWHNDPDPVYVCESNPLESARWMVSWVAVTGSMLTTSEQFSELPPERLDLLRRAMPTVFRNTRNGDKLIARPVDLFDSETPRIWLLTDTRKAVRRDVIGLFNWNENEAETVDCSMSRIGLDDDRSFVAFDYWANEFVEPFGGDLHQTLPAGTCRVLAVRPEAAHPQLLSTSRHITQGVIDVLEEQWDADSRTLSGRSKVVAGDPYELRIALPAEATWNIKETSVSEGATIKAGKGNKQGVRVMITPQRSGKIRWSVRFKK